MKRILFLNLQKVIVGGIVAAVIVTGDKVTDTECEMGYVKVDNVCVDMCDGINCGIGGECLFGNCTCQEGYTNGENLCEETCALTPCKELTNLEQNIGILKNGSHLMNPDLMTPLVVMFSFSLSFTTIKKHC